MSKFFFSSGCCSGRVRLESDSATTESPKALKRPSNESVLKSEAVALKSDRVAQDSHASRMVFQLQDGVWAMAAFGQFPAGQEQVQQVLGRSLKKSSRSAFAACRLLRVYTTAKKQASHTTHACT